MTDPTAAAAAATPDAPPRRMPVLRKERLDTVAFGPLVVRQLLLSQRIALTTGNDIPTSETDAQRRRRTSVEYAHFLNQLLAEAVVLPGTDPAQPAYSADDWDIWGADETAAADFMRVLNRALALNGYRTVPEAGEQGAATVEDAAVPNA